MAARCWKVKNATCEYWINLTHVKDEPELTIWLLVLFVDTMVVWARWVKDERDE
jgi:hypothetical protein